MQQIHYYYCRRHSSFLYYRARTCGFNTHIQLVTVLVPFTALDRSINIVTCRCYYYYYYRYYNCSAYQQFTLPFVICLNIQPVSVFTGISFVYVDTCVFAHTKWKSRLGKVALPSSPINKSHQTVENTTPAASDTLKHVKKLTKRSSSLGLWRPRR